MTFLELQDIMESQGVKSLAGIARTLGVSPQSVSNWKARDQVPYKYVLEIQNRYGPTSQSEAPQGEPSETPDDIQNDTRPSSEIRHAPVRRSSDAFRSEGGSRVTRHSLDDQLEAPQPTPAEASRHGEVKRSRSAQAGQTAPLPPGYPPYAGFYEEDTISLSDILLVLAKHIKIIILLPVITVFLTLIYVKFIQQPLYLSTVKLLLPEDRGNVSGLAGLASQFGVQVPTGEKADLSSASLFPELINSRTFAETILDKPFFTEKYEKELSLLAILTHGDDPPLAGRDTLIVSAMAALPGMIRFEREGSFSVLEVETFEPQLASDIANAVLKELEKLNRMFRSENVSERREFIEERILSVETDLERSEQALKEFREANRQISNSPALLLKQDRISRDVEIQKGIYLTLKQQLELVKIEEVQESSVVRVLDHPNVPLAPSNKKTKMALLLSGFLGIGLGVSLAFLKGYTENINEEEKIKIGEVKSQLFMNVRGLLADRKITGAITVLLLIGLPFILGHESRNPEFLGKYSLKAFTIIIGYFVILLLSSVFVIISNKLNPGSRS